MTDAIDLVRSTWAKVATDPEAASALFYATLFKLAPETEQLFKSDLEAQGAKLTETLAFVVDHLDDPDTLLPAARDLAIRHTTYGVAAGDYDSVGTALLQTLESALGTGFAAAEKSAWADTYQGLADYMITQAYPKV